MLARDSPGSETRDSSQTLRSSHPHGDFSHPASTPSSVMHHGLHQPALRARFDDFSLAFVLVHSYRLCVPRCGSVYPLLHTPLIGVIGEEGSSIKPRHKFTTYRPINKPKMHPVPGAKPTLSLANVVQWHGHTTDTEE